MNHSNILFLNLIPHTVGDSLFLVTYFKIIKQNNPACRLTITASPSTYDLLRNEPFIDEFIIVPELAQIAQKKTRFQKAKLYFKMFHTLVRTIHSKKFDLCFVGQPNFVVSPLIPFLARIPQRVGYTYKGSHLSFLLTKKTLFRGAGETNELDRHFIEANLDLMRLMNYSIRPEDTLITHTINTTEHADAKKILLDLGISDKKIIAIQHGAKWVSKSWPTTCFTEVIRALTTDPSVAVILVGSLAEFDRAQQIMTGLPNTYNLCGAVSLGQLAALLSECKLTIGNDSGISHLASAVGTPVIVLYFATNPLQSTPMGPGKVISLVGTGAIAALANTMKNITAASPNTIDPTEVITAALNELAQNEPAKKPSKIPASKRKH